MRAQGRGRGHEWRTKCAGLVGCGEVLGGGRARVDATSRVRRWATLSCCINQNPRGVNVATCLQCVGAQHTRLDDTSYCCKQKFGAVCGARYYVVTMHMCTLVSCNNVVGGMSCVGAPLFRCIAPTPCSHMQACNSWLCIKKYLAVTCTLRLLVRLEALLVAPLVSGSRFQ